MYGHVKKQKANFVIFVHIAHKNFHKALLCARNTNRFRNLPYSVRALIIVLN
jgi:hypothetical protein